MRISIDTGDIIRLQGKLGQKSSRLKQAKSTILKKAVLLVERYGKYYAPVDTGRLRASIGGGSFCGGAFSQGEGIDFSRLNDSIASIGPTVVYAKHVHSRTPFMTAAVQSAVPEIEKVAIDEVRQALK